MSRSIFIIKNLSKKFKNGNANFYAVKNVNLEISDTGFISVIGKSGSGKSTFLNLLSGIEKPTSGFITFNKQNISRMSDAAFSKYHLNDISMIYQHYNLFNDLTAIDNVLIPLKMKGISHQKSIKEAKELFARFGMIELMNKKVKILSGGEKQRVAIIRALVTEPKVLLCDEPTGALDSKNSIMIMEILSEISKTKLVILVSHNNELVTKYSDRIILFKDGEIVKDTIINQISNNSNYQVSKYNYSSKWINSFLKLNLKRNRWKIVLSFITFIIGFSAVFLSIGFSTGAKESQKNALDTNLAVGYSTVSETTYLKIENSPLSFEKNVKPSTDLIDEKLQGFSSVIYAENLSYFFSNYPKGKFKNEDVTGFEMIPLYNISENNYRSSLLISGTLPHESIEEVIVNKEFVDLLGASYDRIVNQSFIISYSTDISVPSGDVDNPVIKDSFSYSLTLRIKGVVNEFSFLNTPKIYYSYLASKDFLKSQYSEVISENNHKLTTFYDLVANSSSDNIVSSYSSILFLTSLEEKDNFFELIKNLTEKEDNLKVTSTAYDIQTSYCSFIDSFTSALYVFVIIAFVGINLIIGMISLSNFIQNKKESAILTCLGSRNKSITSIYLTENYLILLITLLLSIFISIYSQQFINQIIYEKFSLNNLINIPIDKFLNVKLGLPITIFVISTISISIFTLIPLFVYRKISLVDELRDE